MNEKAFYTIDGKELITLSDLINYLKSCDSSNFNHHVRPDTNDFANWINFIFGAKLGDIVRSCNNKESLINALEIYNFAAENKTFFKEQEDNKKDSTIISENISNTVSNSDSNKISNINSDGSSIITSNNSVNISDSSTSNFNNSQNNNSIIIPHSYDETEKRLEKYLKFLNSIHTEFIRPGSERANFLKSKLEEINSQISQLRKNQKNPIIPDTLVKLIKPKIEYFSITNDEKDYEIILKYFEEIINEINYCENEKQVNIRNELGLVAKNV